MTSINENDQIDQDKVQSFLQLHTASQHRIYGFIMSLVSNWADSDDVYQETLSVLWKKFDEFVPGTNFLSWAFKIAHFQVLSYRAKKKIHRKYFSQAVVEKLSEVANSSASDSDLPRQALRKCVKKLPEQEKHLLALRYEDGATIKKIAQRIQRSVNTLYKTYSRIHVQLFNCIRKQLNWDRLD